MSKPKIFVKSNKNLGICDITFENVRTDACKKALTHFQGRDIRLYLKQCLEYTQACIDNDEEKINSFYHIWNPRENA